MNIKYQFNWQTFERNFVVSKFLPVKAGAHTDTGRIKKIILKNMTFYVTSLSINNSSSDSTALFDFNASGSNFGTTSGTVSVNLPLSSADLNSSLRTMILSWANTNLSLSLSDSDIIIPSVGAFILNPRLFSNPSLAVNTSRQPSTTRDTLVNASVDITSTISLTTGQTGKVSLQYADNTGFSTNVVTIQTATNGNTGALTIGLNLSQVYTAALTGIVPAGKFYRLVTTNVTGTPTYGTPVIQEVLL